MSRIVRGGLIQCANPLNDESVSVAKIKQAALDAHLPFVEEAARKGVKILCLQEIFNGPYFCPGQSPRWYEAAESVPGPTTDLFCEIAKKHSMVIVVPVYEREQAGVYYNTAAVIDADGTYLGKYRKTHIPQVNPGFFEKFYFKPGNLGYPVFQTAYAKVGVYICYDRHFPEGARILGLHGAEIVMNPSRHGGGASRSTSGRSSSPRTPSPTGTSWARSTAWAPKAPWNIGKFYGTSYFVEPAREPSSPRAPRTVDELDGGRPQPRPHRGGAPRVAVLPRPPPGRLRRPRQGHLSVSPSA
jgi:beta-ureidopropionase